MRVVQGFDGEAKAELPLTEKRLTGKCVGMFLNPQFSLALVFHALPFWKRFVLWHRMGSLNVS